VDAGTVYVCEVDIECLDEVVNICEGLGRVKVLEVVD
jgi:hypothetical protein